MKRMIEPWTCKMCGTYVDGCKPARSNATGDYCRICHEEICYRATLGADWKKHNALRYTCKCCKRVIGQNGVVSSARNANVCEDCRKMLRRMLSCIREGDFCAKEARRMEHGEYRRRTQRLFGERKSVAHADEAHPQPPPIPEPGWTKGVEPTLNPNPMPAALDNFTLKEAISEERRMRLEAQRSLEHEVRHLAALGTDKLTTIEEALRKLQQVVSAVTGCIPPPPAPIITMTKTMPSTSETTDLSAGIPRI